VYTLDVLDDADIAALKLRAELELRGGAVRHAAVEPGRLADATTARLYAERPCQPAPLWPPTSFPDPRRRQPLGNVRPFGS
jgi:hypothetical protein